MTELRCQPHHGRRLCLLRRAQIRPGKTLHEFLTGKASRHLQKKVRRFIVEIANALKRKKIEKQSAYTEVLRFLCRSLLLCCFLLSHYYSLGILCMTIICI